MEKARVFSTSPQLRTSGFASKMPPSVTCKLGPAVDQEHGSWVPKVIKMEALTFSDLDSDVTECHACHPYLTHRGG